MRGLVKPLMAMPSVQNWRHSGQAMRFSGHHLLLGETLRNALGPRAAQERGTRFTCHSMTMLGKGVPYLRGLQNAISDPICPMRFAAIG